jgi:hypothetical protein
MSLRSWFSRRREPVDETVPPPWEPRANPYAEYAYDLIPVPGARIRLRDVDPRVADALLAADAAGEPGVAVPGPGTPAPDDDSVWVRVAGAGHRAGRVPDGYAVVYTEAFFRGVTEIPLAVWATPDGAIVDLLMDRPGAYGP